MKEKYLVRIVETELENFKNVNYGDIKFVNYSNAEYRAELKGSDINGIYGQNGSGKTAIIEAFDILQHVMSGTTVSYNEYDGMFHDDRPMKISTIFYIECGEKKYKARYELLLKRNIEEKNIQIYSENIIYWRRGGSWKTERNIQFCNPYYDTQSILENTSTHILSENESAISKIRFFNSVQNLAVFCAQKNVSLFFNDVIDKSLRVENQNEEETAFSDIVKALFEFSRMRFQVVKVNQLGVNYSNVCIPVNVYTESENEVMQGCIPLFMNGRGDFPEEIFDKLKNIVAAINIALKAVIPNLFIELGILTEMEKDF